MRKQFVIKPIWDDVSRHGIILEYYQKLASRQAKAKICEASSAFWESLRVWEERQNCEEAAEIALLCVQKLKMQSLEVQKQFGVKREPLETLEGSLGLRALKPDGHQATPEIEWILRPRSRSSLLPILTYLVCEETHLTTSEKYWIPSEAYWGAYAAAALGLSSDEIEIMVQHSLRLLEGQQDFLKKRFVERKSPVESVIKETTESTTQRSLWESSDKPERVLNPEVEALCANEEDLEALSRAFQTSWASN